jgi:opacity protein-like surface antigen
MKLRTAMVLVPLFVSATAQAQVVATPYFDTNVAGDVEIGRGGVGASLGYYWRRLGLELDLERHPHFFKDEDVAGLVPAQGVDLDTDATLAFVNAVVPYRLEGRAGVWCPYLVAGMGVIRAEFDSTALRAGAGQSTTTRQDDLSFTMGGGVMHALTDLVGLRVDLRYLHALVDESAGKGGYFKDYGFWRVSVGFTIGFPRQRAVHPAPAAPR